MVRRIELIGPGIVLSNPAHGSFSFSAPVQRLVAFRCSPTRTSREEAVPESYGRIVPFLDCFTAFYFSLAESFGINYLRLAKTVSFCGKTLKRHGHYS